MAGAPLGWPPPWPRTAMRSMHPSQEGQLAQLPSSARPWLTQRLRRWHRRPSQALPHRMVVFRRRRRRAHRCHHRRHRCRCRQRKLGVEAHHEDLYYPWPHHHRSHCLSLQRSLRRRGNCLHSSNAQLSATATHRRCRRRRLAHAWRRSSRASRRCRALLSAPAQRALASRQGFAAARTRTVPCAQLGSRAWRALPRRARAYGATELATATHALAAGVASHRRRRCTSVCAQHSRTNSCPRLQCLSVAQRPRTRQQSWVAHRLPRWRDSVRRTPRGWRAALRAAAEAARGRQNARKRKCKN